MNVFYQIGTLALIAAFVVYWWELSSRIWDRTNGKKD